MASHDDRGTVEYLLLGHVTVDRLDDRRVVLGGTATYAALTARNMGARARLLGFLTMNRWIVEPCHLLLGLLRERDCTAAKTLLKRGVTLQAL